MSQPPLNDRTKKELADLARRRGVPGWEAMRKDDLVKALSAPPTAAKPGGRPAARVAAKPAAPVKVAAAPAKPTANGSAKHLNGSAKPAAAPAAKNGAPAANTAPAALPLRPAAAAKPEPAKVKSGAGASSRVEAAIPADKDLSAKAVKAGGVVKDRIVLTAPDPFWLHAFWEINLQSVQRAEAALGQDWHGARPIIRLFDVTSADTTSTSEAPLRDIIVHGGCSHWYIDVPQPPRAYRADIGYVSRRGLFFVLARSNTISPPKVGASEPLEDGTWSKDTGDWSAAETADAAHAHREVFDDQFRRPLKDPAFGTGATLPGRLKKFFFDLDAELIVYGKTDPSARVTLQNEGVKLRADGTFTMRFSLPDSRQIIPAVATSTDGMEEQTIVLAVERNTKRLDPMTHDVYGEG